MSTKVFIFLLISCSFAINKTYVFDIIFQGNSSVATIELETLLRNRKKSFFSTTEFKVNKLNLDIISIQSFYRSKGYLDVKIDYSYDNVDDNNVTIIFFILEGIQYEIRNISIMGNKSFNDKHILELLDIESIYYNPNYIRKKLLQLKNEYLKIGKINISINDQIEKENKYIDLKIDISEGQKFYIDNIVLSGLETVHRKLIDRELIFNIGEIYNIEKINKSKSYMFESRLFSSIEIFPYINSDSTITLDIRLRELQRRELEFEFGFNQLPSNQGDLPVSAINILGTMHRGNIFNSGIKLSFKTEYGFSYSNFNKFLRSYYELGLYAPWFIKTRIPFRFKVYSENILFNALTLGDQKLGIVTYIESYRSSNPYLSVGLITDFFQSNSSNRRTIYASYVKHNIDNFMQPNNGYYISVNPRLNGDFLGGAYDYLKNDFEFKIFKVLFGNIISATRCKIGHIHVLNSSKIPDFDKFFLGGSSSLRGWLSTSDYNGEVGGTSRVLFNTELRVPIYKIIGLEFFCDAGSLDAQYKNNNLDWNVGWGITVLSALGPARVDFAFKEGAGKSIIQFSLLNMF